MGNNPVQTHLNLELQVLIVIYYCILLGICLLIWELKFGYPELKTLE